MARICLPVTSGRPTSFASRRRRTSANIPDATDAKRYQLPEEKALAEAIDVARKEAAAAVGRRISLRPCGPSRKLRPRVDAFFDKVTVNVDDKALRENRLKLLNEIREATARGRGFLEDRRLSAYSRARSELPRCDYQGN